MSLIPYPNVPNVAGVPAIPRLPSVSGMLSSAGGILQGAVWKALAADTMWGIYDSSGAPLIDDLTSGFGGALLASMGMVPVLSTTGIEYRKESSSSAYPVERGSFADYNKVRKPSRHIVRIALAGSEADRATLLTALDTATNGTDLYSVITPDATYVDYSIDGYEYRRTSNKGTTLLEIDVALTEILMVESNLTTTEIQSPKSPTAEATQDAGLIQTQEPKQSILKRAADKVSNFLGLSNE